MLYNTTTGARERHSKLLLPYADRYVETETLRAGQIGVLLGLRDTRTGDTFIDARVAKAKAAAGGSAAPWAARAREMRLRSVDVPPPVFSMSIEPASRADEAETSEALAMLVRTDPSLRLDDGGAGGAGLGAAGTGQMVLSGMGELHLDIARGRLADEFGAKARMGSVRVSYRETVLGPQSARVEELLDREMLGKQVKAGITCEVRQLADDEAGDEQMGDNLVLIELDMAPDEFADVPKAAASNSSGDELSPTVMRAALLAGATAGLSRGPLSGNALSRLHVRLSAPRTFGSALTPPRALSAVVRAALLAAVRQLEPGLMEPVMRLRIACKEASLGRIVADLTGEQGGTVLAVEHEGMDDGDDEARTGAGAELYVPPDDAAPPPGADEDAAGGRTVIHASAPLARLVAYSSRLRALSAGNAAFEMRLDGFAPVTPERRTEILRELGRAA
jgi:elongation factor G